MVHAALVFEHAGVSLCLENAVSMVALRGALSVVLQLPSESAEGVGASAFPSLIGVEVRIPFDRSSVARRRTRRAGIPDVSPIAPQGAFGQSVLAGYFCPLATLATLATLAAALGQLDAHLGE